MGYVSEIVQSGVALADRAQVGQYVEKARSYERIDALIDLASTRISQHAPDVVKKLDEKVDMVLGGVSDRKAKALGQYNGAVEFVQQKKGDVQERYNGAKELLEQTKDDALARVSGAKDTACQRLEQQKDAAKELLEQKKGNVLEGYNGAVEFVQRTKGNALERVQKNKDEMLEFVQEKKGNVVSLAQEHVPESVQTRVSQAQVQVGLLMSVLVAQYHSILDLPRSVKQRIEKGLPELQQQYLAPFEQAKSWVAERIEQLPQVAAGLAMTKAVVSDPTGQAAKLREMAQAGYAAAKAKAASLQKQLPSYRERASEATRGAVAWVQARVSTKQD